MREYGFNWIITKSGEISGANRARRDVADFIKKLTPEEVEYIKGGGQDPKNISLFDVNPIFSKDKMEETQPADPISQAELDRRMAEIRAAFSSGAGPSSPIEKGKPPETTTSTEIIPDIIKEVETMPPKLISQAEFRGRFADEAGQLSMIGIGKGKERKTSSTKTQSLTELKRGKFIQDLVKKLIDDATKTKPPPETGGEAFVAQLFAEHLQGGANVQNDTPVVNTPESQVPVQQPPAQAADPLTQPPAPVPQAQMVRPVGKRIADSNPNPFPVRVSQFETNENRMGIDAANKAAGDGNDDGNTPSGQGNGGFAKTYTHDGLGRIVINQPTDDSILDTSNKILEIQRQTTAGKEVAANDANNELQIILKILAQYKAETDAALQAHKINKVENVERLLQKPDPATIEAENIKAEAERRRQLMMQPIVWSSTPGPY
jgi:hypothetical protein